MSNARINRARIQFCDAPLIRDASSAMVIAWPDSAATGLVSLSVNNQTGLLLDLADARALRDFLSDAIDDVAPDPVGDLFGCFKDAVGDWGVVNLETECFDWAIVGARSRDATVDDFIGGRIPGWSFFGDLTIDDTPSTQYLTLFDRRGDAWISDDDGASWYLPWVPTDRAWTVERIDRLFGIESRPETLR